MVSFEPARRALSFGTTGVVISGPWTGKKMNQMVKNGRFNQIHVISRDPIEPRYHSNELNELFHLVPLVSPKNVCGGGFGVGWKCKIGFSRQAWLNTIKVNFFKTQ